MQLRLKLARVRDNCFFPGYDTTLILIFGFPLKTFTMPNNSYVASMPNVSNPIYDDLKITSNYRTKLSPPSNSRVEEKLLLIEFLKIHLNSKEGIVLMI